MKDIIIIDSSLPCKENSLEYCFNKLFNNQDAVQILFKKMDSIKLEKIVLLPHGDHPYKDKIKEYCKEYKISNWTPKKEITNNQELYSNLDQLIKEKSINNIILCYIDSPLLDIDMLKKLHTMHKENLAEYTFGDNFVEGLVPEILSNEFVEKIKDFSYKKPELLSRKVFDCMDADINKFFIELDIAEYDFSLMRIELTASNKRNFKLIEKLLEFTDINKGYVEYYQAIQKHPEILFVFPKYVEIEITNHNNLNSVYSPYEKMTRKKDHMDFNLYKKIINQLSQDYNDVVVSFSLIGEPLLHPQFMDFVDYALKEGKIFTLIIETNAIFLNKELIKKLSDYPPDKLILLFYLDSVKKETYNKINQLDDNSVFDKAINNITEFINKKELNKVRSFVQIMKMQENNLEIEDFYKYWQTKGVPVVIQKFNTYLNSIKDKSVIDLTPLDRQPCWHIQRDLEILVNGDVPVCKQDFDGKILIGNLKNDSLLDIISKLQTYFLLNFQKKYEEMNICSDCDEWYTYNF